MRGDDIGVFMSLRLSLVGLILTLTVSASAQEIIEQYVSVKALGMGNAYLAHARLEDAVFYNPAGLAKAHGVHWRIVGFGAGLNGEDVYEEYSDLVDDAESDLTTALNGIYGTPIAGRIDAVTSFGVSGFMIGGYGTGNVGLELFNPALPVLETGFFADYGLFAAWGGSLVPNFFDVGIVTKRITRQGGNLELGASTLVNLDSDGLEDELSREGTGYGIDFGASLRFPSNWNPTMNFVWKDIGDTSLDLFTDNAPPTIQSQINVGLGLERDMGLLTLRSALDYRGINTSGDNIGKKFHVGLELEFPVLTLRGGFNQGYYTAGLTTDLGIFELDFATYGVERGVYAGQEEDRRYIIQLSIDLGYEPRSGGFYSKSRQRNNSRYSRKQRR